jgi:hypothetical protein
MADGTPEQVLLKALSDIKEKHPVDGELIVCWYSNNDHGEQTLRYYYATSENRDSGKSMTALLSDMDFEYHINRRSIFGRQKTDVVYCGIAGYDVAATAESPAPAKVYELKLADTNPPTDPLATITRRV